MSLQLETNINENLVEKTANNSNDNRIRNNFPKFLNIALHSVSVFIILSLAIVLVTSKTRDDKLKNDFTNLICFSCEFKSTNTNSTVVFMKEENRCCSPTSEGHKFLPKQISGDHSSFSHTRHLHDEEQSHQLPDEKNSKAVAAHVYLNTKNCSLPSNVILWTRNRQYSFVTNGLNYSESTGIMTVIQQGIYYIYSQLTFTTYSARANGTRYDQLYTQIWLRRGKNESFLMFWKQNVNNSREYLPSFLGGNFELKKDDEIYVKASDPQFLYKFDRANFFGLHFV